MGRDPVATKPRRHLLKKLLLGLVLLIVILIALAPWILGNTGLRDHLVALLIDDPSVQTTTREASVGYFSPFSIGGLEVIADDGATAIQIEQIQAEKSWLSMYWDRPELGTFTFVQPVIRVVVPKDNDVLPADAPEAEAPSPPAEANSQLPILTAAIEDASIAVYHANDEQPVIDLQDIDVTFHLERDDAGSVFVIDPITVFDHQELTPELCDQGLQLIAPLLGKEIGADGEFSFRLEAFQIPIGGANIDDNVRRIEIAGTVELHRASVGLKDSPIARFVGLAAELLGESIPEMLTVANDCEVAFHLVDGRIHHRGFALMLPYRDSYVQLESSGFVSLDGELDIMLTLQLPAEHLGESKLAKMFADDPIQVSITGTMEDLDVELVGDQDWSDRLSNLFSPKEPDATGQAGDVDELGDVDDREKQVETAVEIAERVSAMLKRNREKKKSRGEANGSSERLRPRRRDRIQERRDRREKD